MKVIFWGRLIFNGIYSMFSHLFTAGVLLAAVSMVWAFPASGASGMAAMLTIPAVRFKRESSVEAGAIGLILDGASAFNHSISTIFRALFSFCVGEPWRGMARERFIETHMGFNGFSPYRR